MKESKGSKAGKVFKKLTKYFLIFALCYFVGRTLASVLFWNMSWDDFLNPHEQAEYECSECGAAMQTDKGVCSGTCHEASMI